jgi:hypothetical protein
MLSKLTFRSLILSLVLVAFATTGKVWAQPVVEQVIIDPLNRVSIYFSILPEKYSLDYSIVNKKMSISIVDARVLDSAKHVVGKGVIQDIYINQKENDLEVLCLVKDKRGFTTLRQEFSKSIILEIFRWDKLDQDETKYREGLFALNDHIYPTALKDLTKASEDGNIDAKAVLGLYYFKTDSLKQAAEYLTAAALEETSIPDTYAALTQILDYYGLRPASDKCMAKFGELTQQLSFERQAFTIMEKDHDEIQIIIQQFADKFDVDNAKKDFAVIDTAAKVEAVQDTTKAEISDFSAEDYYKTFLPELSFSFVVYTIIVAAIMFAFFYFSYKNWKKNKIAAKKKNSKRRKPPETKPAANIPAKQKVQAPPKQKVQAPAKQAVSAYAKQVEEQLKKEDKTLVKPDAKKSAPTVEAKPAKAKNDTGIENFEEKLQMIADQLLRARGDASQETSEETGKSSKLGSINARVDLAMHLQEQQKKARDKNIDLLKSTDIPDDQKKLMEVAKNMGLEVGSLETSKNISKVENDENMKKMLVDKFGKGSEGSE